MNTDTGQVYRGKKEIEAARLRGEPVVEVSERVANAVECGMVHLSKKMRKAISKGTNIDLVKE